MLQDIWKCSDAFCVCPPGGSPADFVIGASETYTTLQSHQLLALQYPAYTQDFYIL